MQDCQGWNTYQDRKPKHIGNQTNTTTMDFQEDGFLKRNFCPPLPSKQFSSQASVIQHMLYLYIDFFLKMFSVCFLVPVSSNVCGIVKILYNKCIVNVLKCDHCSKQYAVYEHIPSQFIGIEERK